MKKNLKIGLFGMYGLYNYGCEAIVRGTFKLIKQTWPQCEVILYTYDSKKDKEIVKDLDIVVKNIPMNNGKLVRRVTNKFLRTIKVYKQLPMWDAKSVADDCDIVFSVGGDIYTIPKHITDNKKETRYSPIVEFGKIISKYRPLVIWGASIGPFGDKKEVQEYYINHLKNAYQIFCREEKTFNYLKDNNLISNIQLCSDPAFYIKDVNKDDEFTKGDKLRIALNLSPLSVREQIGENTALFQQKIVQVIKELSTIPNSEIVLVPHVVSPLSKDDNDLSYLKDVYKKIPIDYRKFIRILENAKGFLGTKEFLKTCDIVIASRMHCAVNAVCEGVPTIFLCYSQKGFGMANYIYGNDKYAIKLTEIDKEVKNKTLDILANSQFISEQIKKRIIEIKNDESRIIDLFSRII